MVHSSILCPIFLVCGLALVPLGCDAKDPADAAHPPAGAMGGHLYTLVGVHGDLVDLDLAAGSFKLLGQASQPALTPDGKLIVSDTKALYETDDTLAPRRDVAVRSNADFAYTDFLQVHVDRGGTRIAYTTSMVNLYVCDRADGHVLARFEKKPVGGWDRPTWTPDGRVVVAGDDNTNWGLYVSDAALKTMTRIDALDVATAHPIQPAVSPDGTKIAFILAKKVNVIGIDGTGLTPIDPGTDPEDEDSNPTWSPDGRFIAYRVSGRILVSPAAGGAATDLFDQYPQIRDQYSIFNGGDLTWR